MYYYTEIDLPLPVEVIGVDDHIAEARAGIFNAHVATWTAFNEARLAADHRAHVHAYEDTFMPF